LPGSAARRAGRWRFSRAPRVEGPALWRKERSHRRKEPLRASASLLFGTKSPRFGFFPAPRVDAAALLREEPLRASTVLLFVREEPLLVSTVLLFCAKSDAIEARSCSSRRGSRQLVADLLFASRSCSLRCRAGPSTRAAAPRAAGLRFASRTSATGCGPALRAAASLFASPIEASTRAKAPRAARPVFAWQTLAMGWRAGPVQVAVLSRERLLRVGEDVARMSGERKVFERAVCCGPRVHDVERADSRCRLVGSGVGLAPGERRVAVVGVGLIGFHGPRQCWNGLDATDRLRAAGMETREHPPGRGVRGHEARQLLLHQGEHIRRERAAIGLKRAAPPPRRTRPRRPHLHRPEHLLPCFFSSPTRA
jgi:hypothetical protein